LHADVVPKWVPFERRLTPAARRSQSAIWTRITITSDLELSVRGELSPSERHLFEQLADQLRAILTGRTKHD
jgi:L-alanine-DL-glutamate epimerase-like enolase superfamily enzyme